NANSAPANRKAWGEPKITRAVETIALKDGTAAAERVKEEKARLRAARGAPPEDEASTPTEEEPTAPEAPLTPQAPAEPVAPGTPPGLAPADEATPPPLPDAPATEEEAAPATPAPAAEPENRTGFEDTENEKLQQARDAIRERRRQEQENKAP
ncbi:MAG: hypothetical protein KKA05_04755, partial [Alphaproteobacteria bacterium]|nr:hypothetical protein [Alphaproteobacteria bacterium]